MTSKLTHFRYLDIRQTDTYNFGALSVQVTRDSANPGAAFVAGGTGLWRLGYAAGSSQHTLNNVWLTDRSDVWLFPVWTNCY